MKMIFRALLVLGFTTVVVGAQPLQTNINPALTYYQAFNTAPDYSQENRDYLFTNLWQGQVLPERFGELMAGYDSEFRLLRQGEKSTAACDWGIDWVEGPATLLGHLSRIKTAAVVARLRTMWDLQQNQQTNACEDLLAALALGRNGSRDDSLISAVVQFAVERIICSTVAENFSRFSPESLAEIADGLNAPPARGTVAETMAAGSYERSGFLVWLTNRLTELQAENPGNDAKVMEKIQGFYCTAILGFGESQQTDAIWKEVVAASGGTSDGVIKLAKELEPWATRVADIESLPFEQYPQAIKQFGVDLTNSPNPMVRELFTAWIKARPREFSATADLAMVQAAIQYKLRGLPGLSSVTNPCGQGPFRYERFVFDGVDRGFELSADYDGMGYPEVFIFVEKEGPPFKVYGRYAGQPAEP